MKVSLSIVALALAGACWADSLKEDASARLHVPRDDAAKKGKSALRKAAPFIVAAGAGLGIGFSIAERARHAQASRRGRVQQEEELALEECDKLRQVAKAAFKRVTDTDAPEPAADHSRTLEAAHTAVVGQLVVHTLPSVALAMDGEGLSSLALQQARSEVEHAVKVALMIEEQQGFIDLFRRRNGARRASRPPLMTSVDVHEFQTGSEPGDQRMPRAALPAIAETLHGAPLSAASPPTGVAPASVSLHRVVLADESSTELRRSERVLAAALRALGVDVDSLEAFCRLSWSEMETQLQ